MMKSLSGFLLTFALLGVPQGLLTSGGAGPDFIAPVVCRQEAQNSSTELKQGRTTQDKGSKKPGKPGGTPGFAGDYVDVYVVKVKPERMTDFIAIAEKFAQANQRSNGDNWLALETIYGEGDTFMFVSTRSSYEEIDQASEAFLSALNRAYGKEAAEKLLHDWQNCLAGSHSELRRHRWDLSWNAPIDTAAYANYIGDSRVLRTTAVHVRPGHVAEVEALLKQAKEAGERETKAQPLFVSEVVEGSQGTTFYVTALRSSIGGFDNNPTLRDTLGAERYNELLRVDAESVVGTESSLLRFSPRLSSPPEEVAASAADFWHPKPMVAAAATKAKASAAKPTSEKPNQ